MSNSILQPKAEVVAGYEPIVPSFQGQISESRSSEDYCIQ